MKLNKIILVALATSIAAPGVVFAAKGEKKEKVAAPTFAACDKNNDGNVTKEEFVAAVQAAGGNAKGAEKQFATKDKDSNGKLSKEEYSARAGKKKKA